MPALVLTLAGFGAEAPPADDAPYVLPPWVVTEPFDHQLQIARGDYFASTLGPTSAVTSADWTARGVNTFAEAFRHVPGVMLQESFGGFEPPRLAIRGSGLNSAPTSRGVALLIDGLPLARADGSFNLSLFDPELFPRLEIYRGTLHMALTPAVLGGVLNADSLVPVSTPALILRAEGGDFGAFHSQLTVTGPAQAAVSFQHSDGWRDHSGQQREALQFATRRPVAATTQLEISVYGASADYDVPGPLTLAAATAQPDSVSAAVVRDQPRRSAAMARVAAQLISTGAEGDFAAGLAGQQIRDDFYQLQPNGETDLDAQVLTGHATFSRRLELGGVEHHLLARATFTSGDDEIARYLNVLGHRGAGFAAYRTSADTFALSVEDVVWLQPTLALGGGFTALQGRRDLSGRAPSPALHSSLSFDDVSPRAALLWSPDGRLSLHAGISRSIEPPTFDDLVAVQGTYPNLAAVTRPLVPQSAITFEVGAGGTAGRFGWNITAYRAPWHHEILQLADAAGLPRGAINVDHTLHQGLESSFNCRVLDGPHRLTLTVTSTVGQFTFDHDPLYGNNRLAGVSPHTGGAELYYEHPAGWFAGYESTWVAGPIPVDNANRLNYGGYVLGQLRAGWRPSPTVLVFATVKNIFDRHYIASTAGVLDVARTPATTSIFLPGAGRTFIIGFEWKH